MPNNYNPRDKYPCPCSEEGVKCKELFRYRPNLIKHILKEHAFSKEAKQILIKKKKSFQNGFKPLKKGDWVGI